jgi:ribosomal protein S15P/S13E
MYTLETDSDIHHKRNLNTLFLKGFNLVSYWKRKTENTEHWVDSIKKKGCSLHK